MFKKTMEMFFSNKRIINYQNVKTEHLKLLLINSYKNLWNKNCYFVFSSVCLDQQQPKEIETHKMKIGNVDESYYIQTIQEV